MRTVTVQVGWSGGVLPPGVSSCRPVVAAKPPQRADKKVLRGPQAPAPLLAQVLPERLHAYIERRREPVPFDHSVKEKTLYVHLA